MEDGVSTYGSHIKLRGEIFHAQKGSNVLMNSQSDCSSVMYLESQWIAAGSTQILFSESLQLLLPGGFKALLRRGKLWS
jgi:hypothetical protein